ncbi:MAG TPA: TonB-dependent receptor [Saprospiraceae bacterium]|nr:TonB-dependent receptor [Saprospiraceae bacterium]HMQ85123.1 TonB-dependent receptor [Saprospiraceae bacterium]
MKLAIAVGCLWLAFAQTLVAQEITDPKAEKFTVSGYIKDKFSGEELLYANVFEPTTKAGATTNLYGFYSLTLPAGTYVLQFSYLGYETLGKSIELKGNLSLNVELLSESALLSEVVVTDEAEDQAIKTITMSKLEVPVEEVKKLPSLLGEPDVIKTIQMLPGVTSAGEGTSAFFVRGGSADQNLILIDEAPVYEVSHMFGLFSVFNTDIIKSAELYKGGISAKYGGRLSSLTEVVTRDGNSKQLALTGGIGLLAGKLTVEAPIVKDKASFIVSGRRSYADIFMSQIDGLGGTTLRFHDLNAKINWKANNKNRFFLAAYSGRDVWQLDKSFKMDWGNTTTTFRWNHLFNDRLFSNLTLVYSDFDYALQDTDPVDGFLWQANQREMSLKEDLTYFINPKLSMSMGYQGIYRRFSPGKITPNNSDESIFKPAELQQQFALDHALYVDVEQELSDRLSLNYGLRFTLFQNIGQGTVYQYADRQDNESITILDSTVYRDFEVIKTFLNPEPRFSARYILDEQSSLKLSYNRMVQYIHLISNSTVPIPFATWAPSSPYLDPQKSDQVAIGYFRNFKGNAYEFSAEAFYKRSKELTEFVDNAEIFFNRHLATEFRQGDARAYGLELYLRKAKGRLRGFAGYTWSKAELEIEDINNDQAFPANHDRRHNLNIAAVYDLNSRWNIGANFTYATGRPITLPTGKYEFNGYQLNYFSERNGYRLPDFHRLDISATYEPKKNENKRWQNSFVFGVYNLYNRQNPFTIYTRVQQDDEGNIIGDGTVKEARMVYLFGVLPYFTWNFKF